MTKDRYSSKAEMEFSEAESLLENYVKSESLRRHCRCVETAMRFYASQLEENELEWATVGLLHDFDYEKYPDEHPKEGMKILTSMAVPESWVRAIGSHNPILGIPIESNLEKYLFACDELSGFITAVTYVRPSKSIHEVETKSVLKKLKTAAFAANVSREDVYEGAKLIQLDLEVHIGNLIKAFQTRAEYLGLAGI